MHVLTSWQGLAIADGAAPGSRWGAGVLSEIASFRSRRPEIAQNRHSHREQVSTVTKLTEDPSCQLENPLLLKLTEIPLLL